MPRKKKIVVEGIEDKIEYLGIDLYVLINKLPKFEPLVYIILFLLLSVVILGISYLISLTILKKKEF